MKVPPLLPGRSSVRIMVSLGRGSARRQQPPWRAQTWGRRPPGVVRLFILAL